MSKSLIHSKEIAQNGLNVANTSKKWKPLEAVEQYVMSNEEVELLTGVALTYHRLLGRLLDEIELRVACHLQQLSATKALKELEAQQMVIELKSHDGKVKGYGVVNCKDGECHSASRPSASV